MEIDLCRVDNLYAAYLHVMRVSYIWNMQAADMSLLTMHNCLFCISTAVRRLYCISGTYKMQNQRA